MRASLSPWVSFSVLAAATIFQRCKRSCAVECSGSVIGATPSLRITVCADTGVLPSSNAATRKATNSFLTPYKSNSLYVSDE